MKPIVFLAAALLCASLQAATYTITINGNANSGFDYSNLFLGPGCTSGSPCSFTGQSFSLVFSVEDSLPSTEHYSASQTSVQNSGGNNPATAALTINGNQFEFGAPGRSSIASLVKSVYPGSDQYYTSVSDFGSSVTASIFPHTSSLGNLLDWRTSFTTSGNFVTGYFITATINETSPTQHATVYLTPSSLTVAGIPANFNLPISETSHQYGTGWGTSGTLSAYLATYWAQLNDLTGGTNTFTGTNNIEEFATATAGTDGCWNADPNNGITTQWIYLTPGPAWSVDSSNRYGDTGTDYDSVGTLTGGVQEYTNNAISPPNPSTCTITVYQQMKYFCSATLCPPSGTWYPYGTGNSGGPNSLVWSVNSSYVNSSRGTASVPPNANIY